MTVGAHARGRKSREGFFWKEREEIKQVWLSGIVDGRVPARIAEKQVELAHDLALSQIEPCPRFFWISVRLWKLVESPDCKTYSGDPRG